MSMKRYNMIALYIVFLSLLIFFFFFNCSSFILTPYLYFFSFCLTLSLSNSNSSTIFELKDFVETKSRETDFESLKSNCVKVQHYYETFILSKYLNLYFFLCLIKFIWRATLLVTDFLFLFGPHIFSSFFFLLQCVVIHILV